MMKNIINILAPWMNESEVNAFVGKMSEEEIKKEQDVIPAYEEDVNTDPQAQMANSAKIDLGTGIMFDPDSINRGLQMSDTILPIPARMPDPVQLQPQQMPIPVQQQAGVDPSNPARAFLQPVHKVDEPEKVKPKRADEDKVDVDLSGVNIGGLVKPTPRPKKPGYVQAMPEVEAPSTAITNPFDNSGMIQKFPKIPLKKIEEIGNSMGMGVTFEEYPHIGIISVIVTDHLGKPYIPRCFVIDTGMIIDRRAKLITAAPMFNNTDIIEFSNMYELMVSNGGHKVLDEDLIKSMMTAGAMNITKRQMYSDEYKALNRKIALITIPTKGLNKEERNSLQSYIMKMDKDGWFDAAIKKAPNSRFVFTTNQLDKSHLSKFELINSGVPMYYGTKAADVVPLKIVSDDGHISIVNG